MPRKAMVRFTRRGELREGEHLPMQVERVEIAHDTVRIQLRHLSELHEGQECEIRRSLPASPDGLVAQLLRVCGVNVNDDSAVDPQEAVGKSVLAHFGRGAAGENVITSFTNLEETNHEPVK